MMKKITVFGGGAHAKVLIDCLQQEGRYEVGSILDDQPAVSEILNYPVIKSNQQEIGHNDAVIISITNGKVRRRIAAGLHCDFVTTIHPTAIVSPYARIGAGCQILAGAIVNAGAVIGDHSIINSGCVVEHDCVIGKFVHLAPRTSVGGGCKIGDCTEVGIGSSMIQNIRIGEQAILGAGSVIISDIPNGCTAVGIPAHPIKFQSVTC